MHIRWVWASLVLVASSLSATAITSRVDSFVETEIERSAAPGIAFARVENGEISAKGYGERIDGSGEQVTSETLFPIGSVTKSFTALAIMQLVEAGEVALDDPVSRHLPAFADSRASAITLRQLLNHTSGYSTVQGNSQHGNADAASIGLVQYADQLARIAPANEPGSTWEYSNANYQILGAVIESVSGESYADYISTRIFTPLGMNNSVVHIGPAPAEMATGHRPWFGGASAAENGDGYRIHAPAGGIVSSADDMARYLEMWLNGEADLLSAEAKATMLEPSGPASQYYGLGWSIDPEHGTAYHTGLVPGFETLASLDTEQRKGVVVMVNANTGLGFADTWRLISGVGARAMDQAHEDRGPGWGPKIAYLSVVLLPPLVLLCGFVSWRGRSALHEKRSGLAGKVSLWFPLVAMAGLAWFLISLLPRLFGGSIATLQLYQPDLAWCMIIAAIMAPAWAMLRLALAYSKTNRGASTG